jgi:hypothetical protein
MDLDNFSSDIHALIAGKLTTSDLARIRVRWHANFTNVIRTGTRGARKGIKRMGLLQAVNKAWKDIADRIEVVQYSKK